MDIYDPMALIPNHVTDALQAVFQGADHVAKGLVDCQTVLRVATKLLGRQLLQTERERLLGRAEIVANNGLLGIHEFLLIMAETLAETTHWGSLKTDVLGYVGIDTLQEQIRKKVLRKGFEFNIIVVGRSGLGKSTLINTLFKANISRRSCAKKSQDTPSPYIIPKTTEVKSISHVIEEKGTRLRLTVTDTPGFGDQINNENCWLPILEYINEQYEKYLSEEQSVTRKKHIPDTRVHCCLYFIPPTGHSLTSLDIEFMRRLHKCVNVVPVIAKADTLTVEERASFKEKIKEDLELNGINVYPMQEFEDDPEESVVNDKLRDAIPFAVVGSDKQHQVNGRMVFGRQTQWGLVEVENRLHCEFPDLRDMLIRTHMQDLVEVTKSVHYESFRQERLLARNGNMLNGHAINIVNMNESNL
ncbi:neuronal-specific septin-3-like isoform X2 [Ornithodoros turicata]|uniref:neuronal-specific septin-3-like isoform X2 n=1 Tax=Ornithodoros turicata TaxID=34597 RepID=UPI00313899F7